MADHPDETPDVGSGQPPVPEDVDVPVEGLEIVAPRRAASAEFSISSDVGSEAMMREAMDPANQSLAEALRLSFRVLQVVILVLIVLFVFSGFQRVEDGQSGVLLRWGKILTVGGSEALEPGPNFSWWPYPAGEFVLFADQNRPVNLGTRFWPSLKGDTLAEAVQKATVHQQLRPEREGCVITRGGDIAHIKLAATYEIRAPARFVHAVEDQASGDGSLDADRLVELSLERAAVHVAARRDLQEIVNLAAGDDRDIRSTAQQLLDAVDSGIAIDTIAAPEDPMPPLAIKKAFGELQEARVRAKELVENARQDARTTLLAVAGHQYAEVIDLISQYEDAYELGSEEEAEALLAQVHAQFESPDASGEVTAILQYARSYRSTIERTLGQEAVRFASLLDAYRKDPNVVVQRLWLRTYGNVLSHRLREDVEIIAAPANGGTVRIALAGLDHIRAKHREMMLQQQTIEAAFGGLDIQNPYIRRGRDIQDGPGRQLTRQGQSLGSGR